MHKRMPLSKTEWPSLNVVFFPPVMDEPRTGPPKTVTTLEIIDQIQTAGFWLNQ